MANAITQERISIVLGLGIGGSLIALLSFFTNRDFTFQVLGGAAASVVLERLINLLSRGKRRR